MSRALTSGEIALAKKVFKGAVDYTLVKVHNEKYAFFQPDNSGMTPNGEIHVQGVYEADYSVTTKTLQAFFIHEMTHVWQHQRGILTLGVIGSAIFEIIAQVGDYDAAYPYVLDTTKDLTDYNLEQQASIIEDYFRITQLGLAAQNARAPYRRTNSSSQPSPSDRKLYEAVLRRFLHDPTYSYSRTCTP